MSYHPAFKDEHGMLESYAWPGGYLIEWFEGQSGDSLCAECATRAEAEDGTDVSPEVHEAGAEGYECVECGKVTR